MQDLPRPEFIVQNCIPRRRPHAQNKLHRTDYINQRYVIVTETVFYEVSWQMAAAAEERRTESR